MSTRTERLDASLRFMVYIRYIGPEEMNARHPQAARGGRTVGSDTVGDRVVSLRTARGWNQEEFAAKVDISKSFLSEIENNRGLPGGEILMRLAEVLGATTDYILRGTLSTTEAAPPEPVSAPPELSALAEDILLRYPAGAESSGGPDTGWCGAASVVLSVPRRMKSVVAP